MSGDEDLWYVKTPDGDVHRVTLDQLDEAFQAGRIDGKVMVLPSGATRWQTLGELAGLDDAPPPARTAAPTPSSFRPVSMDLSLDEDAFKKKSPKRLAIGAIASVFVLCGGILVANRAHVSGAGTSSAAAAAITTPPPATVAAPPPPPSDPQPAPVAAAAASSAPQLTDDQKQKLAAADKTLQDKSKARKKTRGTATVAGSSHGAKYKSQGFTTGGNKYDPLNSSL